MTQTKKAIGNLINKYRAVLAKCRLLNTIGSLAVAGALVLGMGGTGMAAGNGGNPFMTNNGDGLNDYIKAAVDRGEISDRFINEIDKPAGVLFLSRAISHESSNASDATKYKAVESTMNAAVVAAVPQMTMGANMAAVGAVTQRTSIAMPLGNMQGTTLVSDAGIQSGANAGDDISGLSAGNRYDKTGFGMWIMPLWQSNNTFGMKVGDNLTTDTHASIGGIAIGADYTWD